MPRDVAIAHPRAEEVKTTPAGAEPDLPAVRRLGLPRETSPVMHLLSNGSYSVMLTSAGSGYGRWGDLSVSRWREDAARDDRGSSIFVRDADAGRTWSTGYQPTGAEPDAYDVAFSEDRARFLRRDGDVTTAMDVLVSAEDDAEVRRVSLSHILSFILKFYILYI